MVPNTYRLLSKDQIEFVGEANYSIVKDKTKKTKKKTQDSKPNLGILKSIITTAVL